MFKYQEDNIYFIQFTGGFEELVAKELENFDVEILETKRRGMKIRTSFNEMVRLNYQSRLLSRILAPLVKFDCEDTDVLYEKAKSIDWTNFFVSNHTFKVFCNLKDSKITHSQFASLRVKDGIVDFFREKFNKRPSVDKRFPDVTVNVFIDKNVATIYLDTSGESLHIRKYRKNKVMAPMQETLAAAIINLIDWDGEKNIYDFMCGSGTLLSEALMQYSNIPAGYLRRNWGFEFLPDYEVDFFEDLKKNAVNNFKQIPFAKISGSDINAGNVNKARKNLNNLPYGDLVNIKKKDFRDIPNLNNSIIVINPPYGVRLGDYEEMKILYKQIGDFLKQKCRGSVAYIYCGVPTLIKYIRLKPTWYKNLVNAKLKGQLLKIELY